MIPLCGRTATIGDCSTPGIRRDDSYTGLGDSRGGLFDYQGDGHSFPLATTHSFKRAIFATYFAHAVHFMQKLVVIQRKIFLTFIESVVLIRQL